MNRVDAFPEVWGRCAATSCEGRRLLILERLQPLLDTRRLRRAATAGCRCVCSGRLCMELVQRKDGDAAACGRKAKALRPRALRDLPSQDNRKDKEMQFRGCCTSGSHDASPACGRKAKVLRPRASRNLLSVYRLA